MNRRVFNRTAFLSLCFICLHLLGFAPQMNVIGSPERPASYLESAENLSGWANEQSRQNISKQLLAMGILMNQRAGEGALAASCAIALAQLESDNVHSSRLWDLALVLDPGRFESWSKVNAEQRIDPLQLVAADCIRFARNGDLEEASNRFERRAVRVVLEQTARDLGLDASKVLEDIRHLLSQSQNDPCRGRIFITRVEDGEAYRVVCRDPVHQRPIGSAQNQAALIRLLSLEARLLEATQNSSWSGTTAFGLTRPTNELRLDDLPTLYSLDLNRPYFRDGRWTDKP